MPGIDAYTMLMLHMNSDFTDDSYAGANSPHTVTAYGSPTPASIDTSLGSYPLTGETGAGKFIAADSDYLTTPTSSDFNLGTGAFTIELWVRFNSLPPTNGHMFFTRYFASGANSWLFDIRDISGTKYLYVESPGGNLSNGQPFTFSTGTWYHVAVIRDSSGNFWVAQNGILSSAMGPNQASFDLTGSPTMYIAQGGGGGSFVDGWIAELRISKGIARWTSNFTPPTAEYTRDQIASGAVHLSLSSARTANQVVAGSLHLAVQSARSISSQTYHAAVNLALQAANKIMNQITSGALGIAVQSARSISSQTYHAAVNLALQAANKIMNQITSGALGIAVQSARAYSQNVLGEIGLQVSSGIQYLSQNTYGQVGIRVVGGISSWVENVVGTIQIAVRSARSSNRQTTSGAIAIALSPAFQLSQKVSGAIRTKLSAVMQNMVKVSAEISIQTQAARLISQKVAGSINLAISSARRINQAVQGVVNISLSSVRTTNQRVNAAIRLTLWASWTYTGAAIRIVLTVVKRNMSLQTVKRKLGVTVEGED